MNLDTEPPRVQSIEGIVRERYPHDIAPDSLHIRAAYAEGVFDGFFVALIIFCFVAVIYGAYTLYLG
jgi:hypothetical protein